jgi:hypothetical protein
MNTEAKKPEDIKADDYQDIESDIFNVDFDDAEEEDFDWAEELKSDMSEEELEKAKSKEEEESDDDDDDDDAPDDLNFEEEEESDDDEPDLDLKAFNKKLGKNFQTEKELRDFMNAKDKEVETDTDEKILNDSQASLDYYKPLVQMNDEDLMRAQFEAVAIQEKKDLNDDDVRYNIEEQIQDLKDSRVLDVKATMLRDKLNNFIQEAEGKVNKINAKKEALIEQQKTEKKESLQNAFVKISKNEKFFGVNLDKKTLTGIYRKVNNGDFLKELETNDELLAEAATLMEMKKEIFKKSSGLSYSDGLKAALEEYDSKKENKSHAKAQKNGTSGSSQSSKELISGFVS